MPNTFVPLAPVADPGSHFRSPQSGWFAKTPLAFEGPGGLGIQWKTKHLAEITEIYGSRNRGPVEGSKR
jgi:hypothetical protein